MNDNILNFETKKSGKSITENNVQIPNFRNIRRTDFFDAYEEYKDFLNFEQMLKLAEFYEETVDCAERSVSDAQHSNYFVEISDLDYGGDFTDLLEVLLIDKDNLTTKEIAQLVDKRCESYCDQNIYADPYVEIDWQDGMDEAV